MAKYYKSEDGNIYKYNPEKDYYLLCTPWKSGEDRRKKREELPDLKEIGTHKANFEVNEVWRNTTFRWEYGGKKYETRGTIYDEKVVTPRRIKYSWCDRYLEYNHTEYTNLFGLCPKHKWTHHWTSKDGTKQHDYTDIYYLCMYQGKLVWVVVSQYIPQVCFYLFEEIDKEPKKWGGWTNINCLRPVYCITDKKFI